MQIVDPLADERSWASPYSYVQNSPVMRVDPSGALDDNYTVDKEGNVEHQEDTDDNFDMLYTKSDWDAGNLSNGKKIYDHGILSDLEVSTKKDGLSIARDYGEGSIDDIFNVFKFAADNSDAEWALSRYNNDKYAVWTSHNSDYVSRIGLNNEISHMHSHSDINFDKELSSMGVGWTENHGGYYYPLAKSPLGGKTPDWQRIINGHGASHEYVYFPNSGNLHYIHNTNRNKPSKIRNIKNHNSFYFGTLNHR
jgi:hypothetical protein